MGEGTGGAGETGAAGVVGAGVAAPGKQRRPMSVGKHRALGLQSSSLLQPPQRPAMQRPNGHCASLSLAQNRPKPGGTLAAVAATDGGGGMTGGVALGGGTLATTGDAGGGSSSCLHAPSTRLVKSSVAPRRTSAPEPRA